MNTCKAALRILRARKLYVVIYLVCIGAMMLGISWQTMRASRSAGDTVYQPDTARVAVIDRDADTDGLASSLRSYLATDSEIVEIADDAESLQQAVASNYVDLIAIVPRGFAERYQRYLNDTDGAATQPVIETVVSYTSGSGSLAQLEVNEFLSLTRTSYLGLPSGERTVPDAAQTVLGIARKDAKESSVAVVHVSSGDADAVKPAASAFAGTIKSALYPLLLVMPICTFLVIGTFNESEIRRRLYASPKRSVSLELQQVATCCAFGLLVCIGYTAATFLLMKMAGVSFEGLTIVNVGLSFISLLVYTLMAIACGFLLGSVVLSEMAVNGFVNVFGLLTMFTSGMSFSVDMMPEPMIVIGKFLPGWWLCVSIDNAFGLGTASGTGVDYGAWASSIGLVALFGVAFVCLGLALGRIRRTLPTLASPSTTQLAK
jgi:ABC-2 type transport system permease protein